MSLIDDPSTTGDRDPARRRRAARRPPRARPRRDGARRRRHPRHRSRGERPLRRRASGGCGRPGRGRSAPAACWSRDGDIHLLSTWDEGVPDDIPREHLYGISFNSQTFLRVLSELDGAATARTVATDALTRLRRRDARQGLPERDGRRRRAVAAPSAGASSSPPRSTRSAPRSASPSGRSPRRSTRSSPGVTERQLTGVFMEAMASQGVTTPATQDVAWITSREQPWQRSEPRHAGGGR